MKRENVLIALGVLVAISPYLGIPLSILGIALPVLGLFIIVIGIMMRRTDQLSLRHAASERALPIHEVSQD
jgi:hypothetical protein